MRSDGRTLVVQIADVLRQAILTGFYSPGELLPPMRELCRAAGVSMIVMNEVVAKLTAGATALALALVVTRGMKSSASPAEETKNSTV